MAFALTSFFADGTRYSGPGPVRATETYVFTITGTTSDVDLDIGDSDGTFWTEALADTTYGELATQVLAFIQAHVADYSAIKGVYAPELAGRIQVATQSGTGYKLTLDPELQLPVYLFDTSNGVEALTLFVEYQLKPNYLPINASYNVSV